MTIDGLVVTAATFKRYSSDGLPCRRLRLPEAPSLVRYLHDYFELAKGDTFYFG